MKNSSGQIFSRREFAHRAAVISASAPLASAQAILPATWSATVFPQTDQTASKLSQAGQAEAESRYQQILTLYSDRLDDSQKNNIRKMCIELQPALERLRGYKLVNGDAPALFLKPLVEREKKPQADSSAKTRATALKP